MDTDVVEVVARFGGTILDVTHVGPTETYRIGTAPGTSCAVPGLTCFPLVDRGTIRRPLGVDTVERDGWMELRVGEVALWISRTKLHRAPLGRPRFDIRPIVYGAATLVAHLAIWLIAVAYAPPERLGEKSRMRLVHVAEPPPPPPPVEPTPKPAAEQPSAEDTQPAKAERVTRAQQLARAKR
jgi:hypothetical protein